MDDLREDLAALRALVEQQQQRIADLEGRLADEAKPAAEGRHTRRQLLVGAAAAVAGGAAAVAGSPAKAANNELLKLGNPNTAESETALTFDGTGGSDRVLTVSEGALSSNVNDSAVIVGFTAGGFDSAILGYDQGDLSENAVYGISEKNTGVSGLGRIGAVGLAVPASPGSISVGVGGVTFGTTAKDIAVVAETVRDTATALAVAGVHRASRAGFALVPAGKRFVNVDLTPINGASLVFATLQPYSGTTAVSGVKTATNSFTIYLTAPAPGGGVRVAWFVVDKLGKLLNVTATASAATETALAVRRLSRMKGKKLVRWK